MSATYASSYHTPIMVEEIVSWLCAAPGGRFIDGTLGGGGHTHALLEATAPDGAVLSIDRDPEAIAFATQRLAGFGDRVRLVEGNYGDVLDLAEGFAPVDGFLVDAGVSSHQLDDAGRGFSFRDSGPLDMRMGPDAPTLAEYLDEVDADELGRVIGKYGEVQGAYKVARAIAHDWAAGTIETTADLAALVERVLGRAGGASRKTRIHPATLVFQALRIAVNRELESLERAVEAIPEVVRPGGRAAFITFHSLEDRVVKDGFRRLADDGLPKGVPVPESASRRRATILTRKPVTASDAEVNDNPRARSAKLRVLEVL